MSGTATCVKVSYRSRLWAERAAREHETESGVCQACRRGARIMAYHCNATRPGHWHIGHRWEGR